MSPLLEVKDLKIDYGGFVAVKNASLRLENGGILGIVGESGSGKTTLGMAMLRLLPRNARVSGSVRFEGRNLYELPAREMRALRGDRLAVIMQNAATSLDPSYTVGRQFVEIYRSHRKVSRREAWSVGVERLRRVGMPAPEERMRGYPHQLSGGMSQRALIALALACDPILLVADEPTSALDVTIQSQVLSLLRGLITGLTGGMIVITHDLGVVAQLATQVAVMHDGAILEEGPVARVFGEPQNAYTRHLLASLPGRGREGRG